jgi:hypothetical protein
MGKEMDFVTKRGKTLSREFTSCDQNFDIDIGEICFWKIYCLPLLEPSLLPLQAS